jgi:serine/threonine protein kinase
MKVLFGGTILGNGEFNVFIEIDGQLFRISTGFYTDGNYDHEKEDEYREKIPFLNMLSTKYKNQSGFVFQEDIEEIDDAAFQANLPAIYAEYIEFMERKHLHIPDSFFISRTDRKLQTLREAGLLETKIPLALFDEIYKSLRILHEDGFVHGDIHVNNVMYDPTKYCLVLIDWDLARDISKLNPHDKEVFIQMGLQNLHLLTLPPDPRAKRKAPGSESRSSRPRRSGSPFGGPQIKRKELNFD